MLNKNNIIKIIFIILCIMLAIPSIIYIIKNLDIYNFNADFNFGMDLFNGNNKKSSAIIFTIIFITLSLVYIYIIKKNKKLFKNIKQILIFTIIVSIVFLVILPFTSSDIFYYMGIGELDSRYNQNPYYVTLNDYANQKKFLNLEDTILLKGISNYWSNTTVIYGPVWTLFCKLFCYISFYNINISLLIFKLFALAIHLINVYLIFKITNKKIFPIIYGLNPFILLEGISILHNDLYIVFFVLLSLYFLLKKRNLFLSVLFLALSAGIKYFTILLLPFIIIYYFKKEKPAIRFKNCIIYGLLFLIVLLIPYLFYIKDITVLNGIVSQQNKYAKSIYLLLLYFNQDICLLIKNIMFMIFAYIYMTTCIEILFKKTITLRFLMRKYNIIICLFLLQLTNFHPWYIIWLFATFIWQTKDMIYKILALSITIEIVNSIYLYYNESIEIQLYAIKAIIIIMAIETVIINKISYNKKLRRNLINEKNVIN